MPDHCCVPKCKSNYEKGTAYVSVFQFPKNEERKSQWCRRIPRADFVPTKRSVVCEKHFQEEMIIREDFLPDRDGKIVAVPRKRPILKENAYPCIFKGCPPYLSEKPATIRVSREDKISKRNDDFLNNFREKDKIGNFADFQNSAIDHLQHLFQSSKYIIHSTSNNFYLLLMDYSSSPKVEKSIAIDNDFNFSMFCKDIQIPNSKVKHITSSKLKLWSEFENLATFLKCVEETKIVTNDHEEALTLWKKIVQNETDPSEYSDKNFILDQIKLSRGHAKSKRYSCSLMTFAYSIFIKSAASYHYLYESKIIHLPSARHLKRLTSSLSLNNSGINEENLQYLATKCQKLAVYERKVNILLDEIYVRENIQFKGNQLSGVAENKDNLSATTIQAFMIYSLKSSYREMISLTPVKNQTACDLLALTKQALQLLVKAGFVLYAMISDNNRINRNMFKLLSPTFMIDLRVVNPYDASNTFYVLFDSVHEVKAMKNNWMNQLDLEKTFICPNFDDFTKTEKVSFSLLRKVYNLEKDSVIKYAPKLNFKVVYPTNIERQNVSLALKAFDTTNCAALQKYGEENKFVMPWQPTSNFLLNIKKWWDIMNVNTPKKGIFQRNTNSQVFRSVNDERLLYLEKFVLWLQSWQNLKLKSRSGCLSEETFFAVIHTTKCMISIIKDLLSSDFSYVLTAKFQTDLLESRFGVHRQMSGSNYHVTVQEVIESERKLRVKSMLKFHSKNCGTFSIKSLFSDFPNADANQCDDDFTTFDDVLCNIDEFEISQSEVEILAYIGGYCVHKLHLSCEACREYYYKLDISLTVDVNENVPLPLNSDNSYIDLLNRGGLKKPSSLVVKFLIHCLCIFKTLISGDSEAAFLKSSTQYNILIKLFNYHLQNSGIIENNYCEVCEIHLFDKVGKIAKVFGNICLKNYCTILNDKNVVALNERKLKKFKNM